MPGRNILTGSIRENLDPFGYHTDIELWAALGPGPYSTEGDLLLKDRPAYQMASLSHQPSNPSIPSNPHEFMLV